MQVHFGSCRLTSRGSAGLKFTGEEREESGKVVPLQRVLDCTRAPTPTLPPSYCALTAAELSPPVKSWPRIQSMDSAELEGRGEEYKPYVTPAQRKRENDKVFPPSRSCVCVSQCARGCLRHSLTGTVPETTQKEG